METSTNPSNIGGHVGSRDAKQVVTQGPPAKRFRFDSFATEFASNPTSPKMTEGADPADNDSGIDAEDSQISPRGGESSKPVIHWKKFLKDQARSQVPPTATMTIKTEIKAEPVVEEEAENLCIKDLQAKAKETRLKNGSDNGHQIAAHALLSLGAQQEMRRGSTTAQPIKPVINSHLPVQPIVTSHQQRLPNLPLLPNKPVPMCSSTVTAPHPASRDAKRKHHFDIKFPQVPLQPFSPNIMFRSGPHQMNAASIPAHLTSLPPPPPPTAVLREIRASNKNNLVSLPPVVAPDFNGLRINPCSLFPTAPVSPPQSSPTSLPSPISSQSNNASSGLIKKPYSCVECKKGFSTQSGYAKHQQLHCSNQIQKSFSCNYCNKGYTSLSALKMHIRTHTLPCKCDVCGKSFSRPWLLQGHVRTHTGEKPFSCTYCTRSFADKSNLRAHLQTHLQTKKYSCNTCHKTFSRMSLLNKHTEGGCFNNGQNLQTRSDECVQTLVGLSSVGNMIRT